MMAVSRLEHVYRTDRQAHGGRAQGYSQGRRGAFAKAATAAGALDPKSEELIALAIGITARCDGCLACHARAEIRRVNGSSPDVLAFTAIIRS